MKVLLVATVQSHICQFHRPLVAMLHEHGCEVHVAARNNLAEKNGLKLDFVEQVFDVPFQRSPFSPKNLGAYNQLKKIIDDGNYDVIHCNTPVGVRRLASEMGLPLITRWLSPLRVTIELTNCTMWRCAPSPVSRVTAV